jgi:hypothetical protein
MVISCEQYRLSQAITSLRRWRRTADYLMGSSPGVLLYLWCLLLVYFNFKVRRHPFYFRGAEENGVALGTDGLYQKYCLPVNICSEHGCWWGIILEESCIAFLKHSTSSYSPKRRMCCHVLVSFPLLWQIPEAISLQSKKDYFGSQFWRFQSMIRGLISWACSEAAYHRSVFWSKAAHLIAR